MNYFYSSFLDLLIGVPRGPVIGTFANETTTFSNGINVLTVLNDIMKHLTFLIGF